MKYGNDSGRTTYTDRAQPSAAGLHQPTDRGATGMSPINDTQRNHAHGMLIRAALIRRDKDGETTEIDPELLEEAARLEAQANEILGQDNE